MDKEFIEKLKQLLVAEMEDKVAEKIINGMKNVLDISDSTIPRACSILEIEENKAKEVNLAALYMLLFELSTKRYGFEVSAGALEKFIRRVLFLLFGGGMDVLVAINIIEDAEKELKGGDNEQDV